MGQAVRRKKGQQGQGQMAKKLEITLLPPATRELRQIIPSAKFQSQRWWAGLDEREQNLVEVEGQQLAAAMMVGGLSDLAKGEHLGRLYEVLHPKGYFQKYLRQFTKYSPKQAYRYMYGYQNAAERLSEPVLKAAMARNMRIFGDSTKQPLGIHTDAVRQLEGKTNGHVGPGPSADPQTVERWLNQVEQTTKETRSAKLKRSRGKVIEMDDRGDPETMLREAYRFVNSRFRRLPNNSRSRQSWLEKLFGYLLADLGVGSRQTFAPSAVPEHLRAVVGRPRLKDEAQAD